jgi:hypothetical protein
LIVCDSGSENDSERLEQTKKGGYGEEMKRSTVWWKKCDIW